MLSEHKVHQILADMIEDYENGNADHDLQGFLGLGEPHRARQEVSRQDRGARTRAPVRSGP
jgi:hypothetical protein